MKIIFKPLLEDHVRAYNSLIEFKPIYDNYRKWQRRPIKRAWPPEVSPKQKQL